MKNIVVLVAIALLSVASTVSAEGTPDGLPPAMETVCDGEPAPGRGLCVAFCEAMDCDSDPNASVKACGNVKANWQKKTGGTDLPCEMNCPCNDLPEFVEILSSVAELTQCLLLGEALLIGTGDGAFVGVGVSGDNDEVCAVFSQMGGMSLPLTENEAVACRAQVMEAVDAAGLVCQ